MKLEFDTASDAAYFEISDAAVATPKEIELGIIADDGADDRLIGIEVLSVSKRKNSEDGLLDYRTSFSTKVEESLAT
ncbi:DUF2283 domain-containing protein [Thiorhodococcus minor]|uniref:DUF2283 domain-containing protein n=2 Tax=Thiorhodococcus minor TaxID=57489 RepID=A0A6M0K224_9GAMM|nr:DUF2283 domain-containing protein [Thiorhodococcus minor]